ncbi:twin-arginine translocation signal domain-containing protein [Fodinicola feengrottensis]|uniref:twin-arginine translocation signal domain-containing protein n=1 Tax=Fodinicola feengrottensis TaxID=435914 RepID=UPI0013D1E849|nr:twin-arginine translocation signal domain-containing protein [Fodinicola feengrottensis]
MTISRQISRRQVLRVGAVVAAATATTLAVDNTANAAQSEPYQPTGNALILAE